MFFNKHCVGFQFNNCIKIKYDMKNLKKLEKQFADQGLLDSSEQKKLKGGFLFRMLDQVRCDIERVVSWSTGGNGSGDW